MRIKGRREIKTSVIILRVVKDVSEIWGDGATWRAECAAPVSCPEGSVELANLFTPLSTLLACRHHGFTGSHQLHNFDIGRAGIGTAATLKAGVNVILFSQGDIAVS